MRWVWLLSMILLPGALMAQDDPTTLDAEPTAEEEPGTVGEDPPIGEEPAAEEEEEPIKVLDPDAVGSTSSLKGRFYVGGWLGASFGDIVSSVQVAPELGFIVVPKFHLGGSVVYRYRKDKRFEPDLSTTEVGGSLFGRYFVYAPIFLQAGVEQISWEFPILTIDGDFELIDTDHTAVLVGPGFALPMGPKAATYMTFLYDINYDSDEPNPYDRPWMIRVGVGIGL